MFLYSERFYSIWQVINILIKHRGVEKSISFITVGTTGKSILRERDIEY